MLSKDGVRKKQKQQVLLKPLNLIEIMPQIKNLSKGITQHTAEEYDERFYITEEGVYYPSMTFILECTLPSVPQLFQWVGDKGYEESQRIKNRAGDLGTYVHEAIEKMIKGEEIRIENIELTFPNPKEALSIKRSLLGFLNFVAQHQPEFIESEYHFIAEHRGWKFGGTIDCKCKIKDKICGIDFKTSNSLYDKHRIQLTGYGQADKTLEELYLLHLGNGTKQRYTLSRVEPEKHLRQFELCLETFYLNNPDPKPTQEDFPETFKIS